MLKHRGLDTEDDKVAADTSDPMSPALTSSAKVETTLVNMPALLNSCMTWKTHAQVKCRHKDFKGTYYLSSTIIVNDVLEDVDYAGAEDRYTPQEYQGKHKDRSKGNHHATKTGQGSYPHPSITADDCASSGQIYGRNYGVDIPSWESSYTRIPW